MIYSSDKEKYGKEMYNFIKELFPICRSITGRGTLKTLEMIQEKIPIEIKKVKSGTKVFDWEVPKEWNIKEAYIADLDGNKIIDFKDNNLHLVSYSTPIDKKISKEELVKHLHYIENKPDWIPYRTSYYNENWGFCLTYNQFKNLQDDEYYVKIDSTLKDGHLYYGEYSSNTSSTDRKELLFSTYICHPSMCNDNLSGVAVLTYFLLDLMKTKDLMKSSIENNDKITDELKEHHMRLCDLNLPIRVLFLPETIGAITWLALNEKNLNNIIGGSVVTCVGDDGEIQYKKSKKGDGFIDNIISDIKDSIKIRDFVPLGSDERQFCSQGINLPMGCITRTPYGEYDEYHTSADNLDFISEDALSNSLNFIRKLYNCADGHNQYKKYIVKEKYSKCEINLGKRNLYPKIGGVAGLNTKDYNTLVTKAAKWLLSYSDGNHTITDISKLSGIDEIYFVEVSKKLLVDGVIEIA